MRTSWWLAGALATLALVGGCAQRSAKIDEASLGRLPIEAKQETFTAQHNATVAKANLAATERARSESKVFAEGADADIGAAKARLQASQIAIRMAERSHDERALQVAQRDLDLANKMLIASRIKKDYADKIVELRNNEVDLANKQVTMAEADVAMTRAQSLQRNGVQPAENIGNLQRNHDEAAAALMVQESKVASLRDEVNGLRQSWEERRREFNVASRGVPMMPAPALPAPPERIAPEPLPKEQEPQR